MYSFIFSTVPLIFGKNIVHVMTGGYPFEEAEEMWFLRSGSTYISNFLNIS